MEDNKASDCCILLATSSICQSFYAISSSLAVLLWVVMITVKNDHPGNIVLRWDTFIVQDWGNGVCTNGTRVDSLEECEILFSMYRQGCGAMDEEIDTRSGGTWGCHVEKDLATANFHFTPLQDFEEGVVDSDIAPVCNVSRAQQQNCYDESRQATLDTVGAAAFFLSFIPAIFMASSRFCVPCCYAAGEVDVPGCLPCNCFAQLDTPYLIAGGIMCIFGVMMGAAYDGAFGPAPLTWLLGVVLNIVASVSASLKLCIMLGCICQDCNPSHKTANAWQTQRGGEQITIGQSITNQGESED